MQTVLNQKPSCLLKGGLAFFNGGKDYLWRNNAIYNQFYMFDDFLIFFLM